MNEISYIIQVLVSGLGLGCIYGLIGIGYCVIYNASGIVNFAQGAFVMLGGMITQLLLWNHGVPLLLSGAIAVACVVAIAIVIERIVVRPLWDRNASTFVMILATLAVQIVLEGATLLIAGDQPKTLPVFTDLPPLRIGTVAISYQLIWIAAASAVIIFGLAAFFGHTRVGKAMRACAINREAAALQGIRVSTMLMMAFALSAALGAIAGILVTPTQVTAFNVGLPFAIAGFIAAIVGGFGRPFGAFLGGLALGVTQAGAVVVFGSGFKSGAALAVLLIFLFVRPQGILGTAK